MKDDAKRKQTKAQEEAKQAQKPKVKLGEREDGKEAFGKLLDKSIGVEKGKH